ncbi:hypothetical protein [Sulfurimonas sp.]
MIKTLLLTFIFISSLFANKVIYLSYDEIPNRVIKGEIFPVTYKALSTVKNFDDILYEFSNHNGLKILDEAPQRVQRGKYYYDTFHMEVTQNNARLPDVEAFLMAPRDYNSTSLQGKKLNVITLNPNKNFSNIIANNFNLQEYKTTVYDATHNIVIFVASAQNCDIEQMHFNDVYKQGIESVSGNYDEAKITYFIIIDKKIENFSFSYFNLLKNDYTQATIPIIVNDDSVSTQSDLRPRDQSHDTIKMYIAAAIAFAGFILILIRRKYLYLVFIILPLIYIINLAIPQKRICIKEGTAIYLLPVENSTIFETTQTQYHLTKEGEVQNFIKVKLTNNKIGWVKNEDTCAY